MKATIQGHPQRCVALFAAARQPSDAPSADLGAEECELLARVAASIVAGPQDLQSAVALIQQRLAAAAAAAHAATQADRMRTLLLATVSHDLRTPLAAAKAAISGLRCRDIRLTADDHDELLATAEESLDLLTDLAASLLDVSRLHAGTLPVFPHPVDLAELIARSLGGRHARAAGYSRRWPDHGPLASRLPEWPKPGVSHGMG